MTQHQSIYLPDESSLSAAAKIIRAGGLVSFPTETVYGLGADATNSNAVAKIYEAKQRPSFDPLIVHVASAQQAWSFVEDVPQTARKLAQAFWPGPLTLVLRRKTDESKNSSAGGKLLSEIVSAGLSTVAVRMPGHDVARRLIEAAGVPVAAPSANLFGSISPTTALHVYQSLGAKVPMILDGGPCATGVESTVVFPGGGKDGKSVILRAGGLSREEIEKIIGKVEVAQSTSQPGDSKSGEHKKAGNLSPGLSKRHYAPRTPLHLADSFEQAVEMAGNRAGGKIGLLSFSRLPDHQEMFSAIEVLSQSAHMPEAAANLFAAMHRLDSAGLEAIFAHRVPQRSLGLAINDRLSRAVAI